MPLNWLVSVIMIVFIYMVLCFLYFMKKSNNININNLFGLSFLMIDKIDNLSFSYLW